MKKIIVIVILLTVFYPFYHQENAPVQFLDKIKNILMQMRRKQQGRITRYKQDPKKKKEAKKKLMGKLATPRIYPPTHYIIKYNKNAPQQNINNTDRNKSEKESYTPATTNTKPFTSAQLKKFFKDKTLPFILPKLPSFTNIPKMTESDRQKNFTFKRSAEDLFSIYLPIDQWFSEVIKKVYTFWRLFDEIFVENKDGFEILKNTICEKEIGQDVKSEQIFEFKLSRFLSYSSSDYTIHYYTRIIRPLQTKDTRYYLTNTKDTKYYLTNRLNSDICYKIYSYQSSSSLCENLALLDNYGRCYVFSLQRRLGEALDDCKKKGKCIDIEMKAREFYRYAKKYFKFMEQLYITLFNIISSECLIKCNCGYTKLPCKRPTTTHSENPILLIYLLQKVSLKNLIGNLKITLITIENTISQTTDLIQTCNFLSALKSFLKDWQNKYKNITISNLAKLQRMIEDIDKKISEKPDELEGIIKDIGLFFQEYNSLLIPNAVEDLKINIAKTFLSNSHQSLCNYYLLKKLLYTESMGIEYENKEVKYILGRDLKQFILLLDEKERSLYMPYLVWDIYKQKVKDEILLCPTLEKVQVGTVVYSLKLLERRLDDEKCVASLLGMDYNIFIRASGMKAHICIGKDERYFYPECLLKDPDGDLCYMGCLLSNNSVSECLKGHILVRICSSSIPPQVYQQGWEAIRHYIENCIRGADKIELAEKSVRIFEELSEKIGIPLVLGPQFGEAIRRIVALSKEKKINIFPSLKECCEPAKMFSPPCGFENTISQIVESVKINDEEIKCKHIIYTYLKVKDDIDTLCPAEGIKTCTSVDKKMCEVCYDPQMFPISFQCSEGCKSNQSLNSKCLNIINRDMLSLLDLLIKTPSTFCSQLKSVFSQCWEKVKEKVVPDACSQTLATTDLNEIRKNYIQKIKDILGTELFEYIENNKSNIVPPKQIKCE